MNQKQIGKYLVRVDVGSWGADLFIEFNIPDDAAVRVHRIYPLLEWGNDRFESLNAEQDIVSFLIGNSELYCEFRMGPATALKENNESEKEGQ